MLNTLLNAASHLQNATRARLAVTSIPSTKAALQMCLALQEAGFISSVVRAGTQPPHLLSLTDLPSARDEEAMKQSIVTQANVATRRLWLGLKYYNAEPVMRNVQMLSTPKRKLTLKLPDLKRIVRGERAGGLPGLQSPGECLFIMCDIGALEARQAVEQERGGMAIWRVS